MRRFSLFVSFIALGLMLHVVAASTATATGQADPAASTQAAAAPGGVAAPSLPPDALPYLAAALGAGGALCIAAGARARVQQAELRGRMETVVGTPFDVYLPDATSPHPLQHVWAALSPLVAWLAQFAESLVPARQIETMRSNLAIAGFPYSRNLAQFLAAKAGLAIGLALLIVLTQIRGGTPGIKMVLFAGSAGALGFYLPGVWLARRMAQRRQHVIKALPDALDLLTISVGAGLGFDGALLEVVQRWSNPLTEEFSAVLRDLKLGKSRRDSLRAFAQRTGTEEVSSFVAAIIQADELGTPVKDVLQIQAEQIRRQRRYKAEERARKAVVKMLVPMAFFIFPALFVVILGPAIPSLQMIFKHG